MKDIPDEIQETLPQKLAIEIKKSGLLPALSVPLVEVFKPLAVEASELIGRANDVLATEPDKAKEVRLELKRVRCAVEKLRKSEKSESLKLGSAIDGVAKVIFNVVEPTEARMEEIEKAEEIAAQKAKVERSEARRMEIAPFGVTVEDLLLLEMNPDAWAAYLAGAKMAHEKRLADEAAAVAAARIAEEKRSAEEKRLREENNRLQKAAHEAQEARQRVETAAKAERDALEAKAAQERIAAQKQAAHDLAKVEQKAKVEREAREKLEQAERDRLAEDQKRLKAEASAKAKAARAPDRDKLLAFLKEFAAIKAPSLKTDEAKAVLAHFTTAYGTAAHAMLNEIDAL